MMARQQKTLRPFKWMIAMLTILIVGYWGSLALAQGSPIAQNQSVSGESITFSIGVIGSVMLVTTGAVWWLANDRANFKARQSALAAEQATIKTEQHEQSKHIADLYAKYDTIGEIRRGINELREALIPKQG